MLDGLDAYQRVRQIVALAKEGTDDVEATSLLVSALATTLRDVCAANPGAMSAMVERIATSLLDPRADVAVPLPERSA